MPEVERIQLAYRFRENTHAYLGLRPVATH